MLLLLCSSAVDCTCRNTATVPAVDASRPVPGSDEPDFMTSDDDDGGPLDAAPLPRCTLGARAMLASIRADRGAEGERFEASTLALTAGGARAAMADTVAHQLVLASSDTQRSAIDIGPEPVQALSIVGVNAESTLVFSVATQQRSRLQRTFIAERGALRLIATHRGLADDALGIATCAARDGAMVAWDESPTEGRGVVRLQRWLTTTRADPPTIAVSDPAHDASDPVLAALPDGGAIVAYLSLQEVAVETANQSAADIIVRAINVDGSPSSAAINLTSRPKTRFGVALHATQTGRWIAWRLAADSDHEGLGDGGRVAIVALGPDLRAVRSPDYLTDLDRVPAGRIAIVSEGSTADVYWTERRGDDVVTMRRTVSADGRILGDAREEPALDGQVPFGGDARAPRVAAWGPGGEPGYAIASCPR